MANVEMPAEQSSRNAHIPEQREASSPVPTLDSIYELYIQNYNAQKYTTLLTTNKTAAYISIPSLAKLLRDAAVLHGTDKKQIISKEQGIGSYAITHSADATAVDILIAITELVHEDAATINFNPANIALAQFLNVASKKSEVARMLRQKLQLLDITVTRFSALVTHIHTKIESGEPALARYEEQFYDAEMLANIYTLQNA